MKSLAVITAIVLTGCASGPHYLGSAQSSCGRTDGGAYEISIPVGEKTIHVHAEGPDQTKGKWTLAARDVSICDTASGQCVSPDSAQLLLSRQSSEMISGKLTYTIASIGQYEIAFRARIEPLDYVRICG